MNNPWPRLAVGWQAVWRLARGMDRSFVTIIVAFVVVMPIPGCWSGVIPSLLGLWLASPFASYNGAIRAAAVKTPAAAMPLTALDTAAAELEVIKFGYVGTADGKLVKGSQLKDETFVAVPAELKARCKGTSNPQVTLRRVLGLPPSPETKPAYLLKFASKDIFRPCLSTDSIAETSCAPSPPADPVTDEKKRKHYEFVTTLLAKSYRIGFARNGAQPNEYPFDGYPFTGMGYTYDWGTSVEGHFGVNEFVVDRGAAILDVTTVDLGAFCAAAP